MPYSTCVCVDSILEARTEWTWFVIRRQYYILLWCIDAHRRRRRHVNMRAHYHEIRPEVRLSFLFASKYNLLDVVSCSLLLLLFVCPEVASLVGLPGFSWAVKTVRGFENFRIFSLLKLFLVFFANTILHLLVENHQPTK